MVNLNKHSFSKNCVIALLGVTLAFTPALAIAKPAEGPGKTSAETTQAEDKKTYDFDDVEDNKDNKDYDTKDKADTDAEDTDEWNVRDFIGDLLGLNDEERAELKALTDKLESFWTKVDEGNIEGSLTDEEWDRMSDLEEKAWRAEIKEALTADEYAELEALWKKLDNLKEDENLTDEEWDRLWELENKAYGNDYDYDLEWDDDWDAEWDADWDDWTSEPISNEEYVNNLKGLNDDERNDLKTLRDKSDTYWENWDHFYETEGLSDEEWARMNELETKARLGEMAAYLEKSEITELTGLYDKIYDGLDLTDSEWERMFEIEEKARLAEMETHLSKDEYAELMGLYEKLDQETELSDSEWDRYVELEDKGTQDSLTFY